MKTSKSVEKERVKKERLKKVGESILKDQMLNNPEVRTEVANVRKSTPNLNDKQAGLRATANIKERRRLQNMEDQKRFAESENRMRLKKIQSEDQAATARKDMENKMRFEADRKAKIRMQELRKNGM